MKIGFCGTMSCGKSTLVKSLALLPEFKNYEVRTERSKYLRDLGIPLNTDSTLGGQIVFAAERSSELFYPNLLTDRTIIDVMAFTQSSKTINFKEKEDFHSLASNLIHEYDYIFYVSPIGVEIEDNGTRTTDPEYRNDIDNVIKYFLSKYKTRIKNLTEISGDNETRIGIVKKTLFG